MKLSHRFLVFSIIGLACKGDPGPAGPAGQFSPGNISGFVILADTNGSRLNDRSGVVVTSDPPTSTATTQSDGSWTLSEMPAGIYDLTFSKAGYFTSKEFNLQFVGGGTYYIYPQWLEEVSLVTVTLLQATSIDSTGLIHFEGTTSGAVSEYRGIIIVFSSTPFNLKAAILLPYFQSLSIFGTNHFSTSIVGKSIPGMANADTLYAIAFVGTTGVEGLNYNPKTLTMELDTPDIKFSNIVKVPLP
jgi:hypothetical protein